METNQLGTLALGRKGSLFDVPVTLGPDIHAVKNARAVISKEDWPFVGKPIQR